ncbi:MAG: GAF domain-containing protein [Cytophagales bacterium]
MMRNIFRKDNTVVLLLVSFVFVLIVNAGITYNNGNQIVQNNLLKKQTDDIKVLTNSILYDIIHGADLAIRGYGLTKNVQLKDPLKQVLKAKNSIFDSLRSHLIEQEYSLASFTEMRTATDDYLEFAQYMLVLAEKDSSATFLKMLNEDRGYIWWKKFQPFREELFKYEDQLNAKAQSQYETALVGNSITQILLLLLGIPTIIYIVVRLVVERRERRKLLAMFETNNKKYVFDPGDDKAAKNTHEFVVNSIQNFQTASNFINSISEGDYKVEWDGLNDKNLQHNEQNVAGRLVKMRDKLIQLKIEEEKRLWTNEGLAKFSEIVRNQQQNLEELCLDVVKFLTKYLKAQQGSLFVLHEEENSDKYLELKSCYAYDRKRFVDQRVEIGEGLLGQAFLEAETMYMTDIPQNYTKITSGLGLATPSCLAIVPMKYNEKVEAILELASFENFEKHQIAFLEKAGEFVASAMLNAKTTVKMKALLESTLNQSEQLRAAEEEMRQNMEEQLATQEELERLYKEKT